MHTLCIFTHIAPICKGMDNPKKLVHEHCKKLLLNLLANLCPNFENCRFAALMIDTNVTGPTCLLPAPAAAAATSCANAQQHIFSDAGDHFCLTEDGGPCKPTVYISTHFHSLLYERSE